MHTPLFTAIPSQKNTQILNALVKETICEKLATILSQVGEQLDISLNEEICSLSSNKLDFINPALFFYYFRLKEVISGGNLNEILDVISILSYTPAMIKRGDSDFPEIISVLNNEWEKSLFDDSARKDQVSDFGLENKYEIIHPIFKSNLDFQRENVKSAIEVLNKIDSVHKESTVNSLYAIKLFDGTVRGFSYQAAYGNIYIRVPKATDDAVAYYLEHIVHECAHQYLFALQLIDPVVLNDSSELYDAPIRIQKRPMNGIFHACFVLARMVRCFRKTGEIFKETNVEFLDRIDCWFNKSYNTVNEYAKLTDNGKKIFLSLKECAYD